MLNINNTSISDIVVSARVVVLIQNHQQQIFLSNPLKVHQLCMEITEKIDNPSSLQIEFRRSNMSGIYPDAQP